MRTPKEYNENLKNHIITAAMLSDCIFSVNKRAKNYRDRERLYRGYYYDKFHNKEQCRAKKEEYYKYKDQLLKICNPCCIHTEMQMQRTRIYDYEKEYKPFLKKYQVVYNNCYYDGKKTVYFYDCLIPTKKYYLYYELPNHTFHHPLGENELKNYQDLEMIDIGGLTTEGKDIADLVSMQFVKKVLELIENGKYVYQAMPTE